MKNIGVFLMTGTEFRNKRQELGFTQEKMGDVLGISKRQIINIEQSLNDVKPIYAKKISEILHQTINSKNQSHDTIPINYYPRIQASAGFGVMSDDLEYEILHVSKSMLRTMFNISSFKGLEVINVYGDSMLPFIKNGETVLFQRTNEVKNNQICIIRVEDDIFIKRVQKDILNKTITLISDNVEFDKKIIKVSEFDNLEILGVVKGKIRLY